MANDTTLRNSLVWLAVVMVIVGICTQSFKKVMVTYLVGTLGIAGVLLPDWEFYNRDYSRWFSPVTEEDKAALSSSSGLRSWISPFRLVAYTIVYGYAFGKWWTYIST